MPSPQFLTVFDLDKTLLQRNISFRFGQYLYRNNFFRLPTLLSLLFAYGCHKIGSVSIERLHDYVFRRLFYGQEQAYIESCVIEFLDHELSSLINPMLHQILYEVQQKGHMTLLLSSSPHFLVHPVAEHFLFDHWEATRYAVDSQGCFEGIASIMEGKRKRDLILELAAKQGISTENITAYTDSFLDRPMLEVVGNPVVVNPDPKLLFAAKRKGWTVFSAQNK